MSIYRTVVAVGAISILSAACLQQVPKSPAAIISEAGDGQGSGSNVITDNGIYSDFSDLSRGELIRKAQSAGGMQASAYYLEIAQRYLDEGNAGQAQVYLTKATTKPLSGVLSDGANLAKARIALITGDTSAAWTLADPMTATGFSASNTVRLNLTKAMIEGSQGKDDAINNLRSACLTASQQMNKACWTAANFIALSYKNLGKSLNSLSDRTSLIMAQLMLANDEPFALNFSNGTLFSQSSNDALERMMAFNTQSSPPVIGALLPISSRFSTAAKSTYKGMQAAIELLPAGKRPRLVLIDIGENPQMIAEHIKQARSVGVSAFIGPLGTDYESALDPKLLNTSRSHIVLSGECSEDGGSSYCLKYALSPESEAEIIFKRLKERGYVHPAILYSQNSWGERFRVKLTGLTGGIGMNFISYTPDTQDFSPIVRPIFQDPSIDSIVIAGVAQQARLIKPQVTYFSSSRTPVIGTSTIYDGNRNTIQDTDLQGTQVPMLPIDNIDDPVNTDIQVYAGQYWPDPNSDSTRFFALGFDTVLLTNKVFNNLPIRNLEGRSGLLSSDGLNVDRQLTWGRFSDGLVEKEIIQQDEVIE